MTMQQYWIYDGFIAEQNAWQKNGWTIDLLEKHATRVRFKPVKQPEPTHYLISGDALRRVCEWFKHSSNNVSVDLSTDDHMLNVELLKMLNGA